MSTPMKDEETEGKVLPIDLRVLNQDPEAANRRVSLSIQYSLFVYNKRLLGL